MGKSKTELKAITSAQERIEENGLAGSIESDLMEALAEARLATDKAALFHALGIIAAAAEQVREEADEIHAELEEEDE